MKAILLVAVWLAGCSLARRYLKGVPATTPPERRAALERLLQELY